MSALSIVLPLLLATSPGDQLPPPAPASSSDPIARIAASVERDAAALMSQLSQVAQTPAAALADALPAATPPQAASDPRVVRHIVRWEVGSQARYTSRYQGVICPPGASGPTWGIGYDGGHQSPGTIRRDWAHRSDADRLAATSGQTGAVRCRMARDKLRDVRVPFVEARQVFLDTSLPVYTRMTRRTYPGVERLGVLPEGALVGNTYNRGSSMSGSRAAEKRYIRDVCVPRSDIACVAAQLRAQKRLWPDVPGLRERRESEARLAEGGR